MIHIIIPVHNRWPETRRCLASLETQTFRDIAVYVVDDGSTDGTAESIAKDFPSVRVIEGSGNLWWTGAMRVGVEFVRQTATKNDYVMSLNNDVLLATDTLSRLHDFVARNPRSIANALSVDDGDRDTVIASGSRMLSWVLNISIHPFRGRSYANIEEGPVQVDMLTGRSTLYPIAVFEQSGNFDSERFPHYAGDVEFTVRARRNGWRLFLVPAAVVYLNQRTTGLHPEKRLTGAEILNSFFSIKSSSNLVTRTKFAFRCCPWYAVPSYMLRGYLKIVVLIFGSVYARLTHKGATS
jgi:GT2 family glycosyltransferase